MIIRQLLFVFAGSSAGFLSGLLMPLVFGVRGAILGGTIAVGFLCMNPWRRRASERIMGLGRTMALALAGAAIAFSLIMAWQRWLPQAYLNAEFGETHLQTVAAFCVCLAYTTAFLLTYRARQMGHRQAWIGLFAAAFFGALTRAWAIGEIMAVPYAFLIGATPFVLLWWLAAVFTDPAWTKRRWDRRAKPPSRETGPIR